MEHSIDRHNRHRNNEWGENAMNAAYIFGVQVNNKWIHFQFVFRLVEWYRYSDSMTACDNAKSPLVIIKFPYRTIFNRFLCNHSSSVVDCLKSFSVGVKTETKWEPRQENRWNRNRLSSDADMLHRIWEIDHKTFGF